MYYKHTNNAQTNNFVPIAALMVFCHNLGKVEVSNVHLE